MERKQNVRKGVVNAQFNEQNSTLLVFEIVLVATGVGLWMQSWWWGGGLFLALIIALNITFLAIVLVFAFSAVWGLIGFGIGFWFFDSVPAETVFAVVGLLAGIGINLSGLAWFRDLDVYDE